jgi:Protein of unknown function (DUF3829)
VKREGRKSRGADDPRQAGAPRAGQGEAGLAAIERALVDYDEMIKGAEQASGADGAPKIGSLFMSNAKSYLVTAKQLMRRLRDHAPYSSGEKMMLQNAGGAWMVQGSPPRLLHDYNSWSKVNRGTNISGCGQPRYFTLL